MEQSSYSTVDFLKRAIAYFGYKPFILQTDNGCVLNLTLYTSEFVPEHLDTMEKSNEAIVMIKNDFIIICLSTTMMIYKYR